MIVEAVTLTPFDRCDRSQAEAASVIVRNAAGSELYLCSHHHNELREALAAGGWTVTVSK